MPNDSFTQNETLCYEAHVLQEILKINELMRQVHLNVEFQGDDKLSSRSYKTSKDENNSPSDRFDNEAREVHFQVTSKDISSPQGKNKFSESVDSSGKERTPSPYRTFTLTGNDQSLKVDELDVLHSTMKENRTNSNVKEKNRISPRRVRKAEDRSIGDSLFSCPFELVEIYSNKTGRNSKNDLDLAFDVNRQTCSMRAFPKEDDKQFKIEKNELLASKVNSNKLKEETCMDKVGEICRKIYTKDDDLQKGCGEKNCQNRNEKCALNNGTINEDLRTKRHTQTNEDSQKINEDFQKPREVLRNNTSELIQDQEISIIDSRLANDETMQINKQNPLDENFTSTSKGAGVNQNVNLIAIFEAMGRPCAERTEEENDFNKSEVTDETTKKCTNMKQSSHSSTFENNVKLQESCVKSDVIEGTHSSERDKDTNNVISRNEEKKGVPTIKGQTSELRSANISSIPRSLKRVAKNHDLFVNEKSTKSLKSSEPVNSATLKIEEGTSEENLRRDVESLPLSQILSANNAGKSCVKIDNLNTGESTDCSKFRKLTSKVEESVSSTFKEEDGQSVKMKCQRGDLNAGLRESNAFGSNSLKPKAEGNTSFTFKAETKCRKMSSNVDSRKSRVIDDNLFEQCTINSNERKITRHSELDDLKTSSSNLSSSLEDVNHQEEESSAERRDASEYLSKENKINIIIEKRRSKENRVINKDVIGGNKNLLRNRNIQSSMIKNERTKERDSDDFCKEVTKAVAKHETASRESRRIGINYEDLNVCKVLTKIHERLTSDWQRMEQLWMKLQISVSAELANPMMMLQLLDKTIARCKSYIHGSNNTYETELEMTKLLSKYVIELVKVVKVNRKSLEDQERRVNQMQSELVQGHYKKRTVLNEIIITSNYWANEIFRLIKNISCLVKRIMAENEEKENVRNLGRCKTQRRVLNSFSTNDAKQKAGIVRSKNTKSELVKKESTVETQMSADSNATNSLKPSKVLNSAKYTEKEKRLDDVTDKKTADNNHHPERVKPAKRITLYTSSNQSKQATSRQKHRAPNDQPVWRPGGAAKIPTFNSVTTLVQKTRPAAHNRERTNLEIAREEKHERMASELKKKPTTEIHSCKDAPKLNVDSSKIAGERNNVSSNTSPRAKPRSRMSRPLSKNFNESEKPFTCVKNYARRSVCDMIREEVTIESKALRTLEEIIKTASENNEEKNVGNVTRYSFQNQLPNETCSVDSRKTSKLIAVEEEMKVNEEEPTRDIDSEQYKKSQNERFQGNLLEKEDYSLIPIAVKCLTPVLSTGVEKDTKNVGINENFGRIPSEVKPNVSLETSVQRSSDAVSGKKYKDNDQKSNENDIITVEKAKMNSHAVSLSMLKEFLYDQGIDVDLVNKAERYLKDKQKARKGLRKKSISFADVSSYVEYDQHFEIRTVLRKEHSWEEKLEKDTKEDIEKSIERDDRKCIKKDVEKNVEKDAGNDTKTDIERPKGEIFLPKTRDVTTCTIKNSNDTCTQTVSYRRTSKCSQTIFKNDSLTTEETQTEVERRNACMMTESRPISDNSAETPKICCSCKFVITEGLGEFQSEDFRNISTGIKRRKIIGGNESENEDLKLKIREDPKGSESRGDSHEDSKNISANKVDKPSSKECSLVFQKLLHQMQEKHEESNASLTSVDSSTTRSLSSKSSKNHNLDENTIKEEDRSPVRIVSSGIVAALQVAAIRARNVYRAFDIHKRILRNNLKKLRKESRQRKKLDKVLGTREEEHAKRTVSRRDSVVRRGNDNKKAVVEVFKNLERAEITSKEFLNEMLSDSRSESDNFENNLDLVDLDATSTNASSSQISFKSIDLEIPRRSSSSVVLRNVRSLMEFLVSETDDVTLERIERRVEKRSSTCEMKFSGNVRMEVVKVNGLLFFSRENLLLLVYGMLCSVIFWCLNFTITCDVVL